MLTSVWHFDTSYHYFICFLMYKIVDFEPFFDNEKTSKAREDSEEKEMESYMEDINNFLANSSWRPPKDIIAEQAIRNPTNKVI